MGWREQIAGFGKALVVAGADYLTKAEKAETEKQDSTPGGKDQDTAEGNPVPTAAPSAEPKALYWDPFSVVENLGYKDKPAALTFGTLNNMVRQTPIIQAIVRTRINQVSSFAFPQEDKYGMGFKIKLRDRYKEPTKAELEWIKQMESFIMRTGVTNNPRGRDNFFTFLRKYAKDSLTFDQACFEIVPNRKGLPAQFYAVDAATIRLADVPSTYLHAEEPDGVRYVQVYDGQVIQEFTQNEMNLGIRNPNTDLRLQGYGESELEMMIKTVTGMLNGLDYNAKFFTQGSAPKGIINFAGDGVNRKQLQAFRRFWYSHLSSVQNAWRTPIANLPDLQYVNLQSSNRDMEFSAWMDFLIKISCACYQIDPAELNFQYGNTGQTSSLNQVSNREKIIESKERGLQPLLTFIESQINQFIIWPINESFVFRFVGLNADTKDQSASLTSARVKSIQTVDEARALEDLPPLPDGKGEVILDSTWLQFSQMKEGTGGQSDMGEGQPDEQGRDGDEQDFDFESMLQQYESKDTDETQKSLKVFELEI